jgi:serine/threonine protein kinase
LLELKGSFPESTARKILKQIINGCQALYALKVVHRDLKLDNILISFPNLGENVTKDQLRKIDMDKEEFVIKIADLGYSRALEIGEKA